MKKSNILKMIGLLGATMVSARGNFFEGIGTEVGFGTGFVSPSRINSVEEYNKYIDEADIVDQKKEKELGELQLRQSKEMNAEKDERKRNNLKKKHEFQIESAHDKFSNQYPLVPASRFFRKPTVLISFFKEFAYGVGLTAGFRLTSSYGETVILPVLGMFFNHVYDSLLLKASLSYISNALVFKDSHFHMVEFGFQVGWVFDGKCYISIKPSYAYDLYPKFRFRRNGGFSIALIVGVLPQVEVESEN